MGVRGELFTTKVVLDNRSYFFNVKENRTGDVFLQIVESKSKNGEDVDRHAVVVFADDMQQFFRGLDDSLSFIDKDRKTKSKRAYEAQLKKNATADAKTQAKKNAPAVKKTGVVHVVSKRKRESGE
jgi:hypothetical protein